MKYFLSVCILLILASCSNIGEKYTKSPLPSEIQVTSSGDSLSGSTEIDDRETKELLDAIEEIADEVEKK